MDQAQTLRRLMKQRGSDGDGATSEAGGGTHVITLASGKGGVGKSCLAANLSALLARSGLRCLLVDGDFGLANLDIMFGVHPQASLEQVLDGQATLQEALVGLEPNLWLLPASSGLMNARRWPSSQRTRLIALLEQCPWEMDLILVDAGAGIQDNVVSLHGPAQTSIIVLTPEPTSLADAYGLIKTLRREAQVTRVMVIVNQVTDGREGQLAFQKLRDVAAKFIDVEIEYLGHCARDEKFSHSVMKRKILLDLEPGAQTSGRSAIPSLELLAKRLKSGPLGLVTEEVPELSTLRPVRGSTVRFREEPVLSAPRKTAMFWRTLLGEVKV